MWLNNYESKPRKRKRFYVTLSYNPAKYINVFFQEFVIRKGDAFILIP